MPDVRGHLNRALPDRGAGDALGDAQPEPGKQIPLPAPDGLHHEGIGSLGIDEGEDRARIAELAMDGDPGSPEQVVEVETLGDGARDAGDEGEAFHPPALTFELSGVLDGDRRVSGHQREQGDVALIEAPRPGNGGSEETDEFSLPEDGHGHGAVVPELGPGAGDAGVIVRDHRLAGSKHAAGEAHARAHQRADPLPAHAVGGGDPDALGPGVVQADRAHRHLEQFAGVADDAGEQGLEGQLGTDRFDDAVDAPLVAESAVALGDGEE